MSKFVIRSMSTTDFTPAGYGRPAQQPVPYHIYLKPAGKRASAWWTTSGLDRATFDTEEEATAERDRLFPAKREQVVPSTRMHSVSPHTGRR